MGVNDLPDEVASDLIEQVRQQLQSLGVAEVSDELIKEVIAEEGITLEKLGLADDEGSESDVSDGGYDHHDSSTHEVSYESLHHGPTHHSRGVREAMSSHVTSHGGYQLEVQHSEDTHDTYSSARSSQSQHRHHQKEKQKVYELSEGHSIEEGVRYSSALHDTSTASSGGEEQPGRRSKGNVSFEDEASESGGEDVGPIELSHRKLDVSRTTFVRPDEEVSEYYDFSPSRGAEEVDVDRDRNRGEATTSLSMYASRHRFSETPEPLSSDFGLRDGTRVRRVKKKLSASKGQDKDIMPRPLSARSPRKTTKKKTSTTPRSKKSSSVSKSTGVMRKNTTVRSATASVSPRRKAVNSRGGGASSKRVSLHPRSYSSLSENESDHYESSDMDSFGGGKVHPEMVMFRHHNKGPGDYNYATQVLKQLRRPQTAIPLKESMAGSVGYLRKEVPAVPARPNSARGIKKSDPLALYQKYQQGWTRGRVTGGERVASGESVPTDKRRDDLRWKIRSKMMGIRGDVYSQKKSKTMKVNNYVCPTDKRRDKLRWSVRTSLYYSNAA